MRGKNTRPVSRNKELQIADQYESDYLMKK
jgi:hypothetical protein